ncbi:MAG: aspartate carbamoyltransferase regulatory subunit [Tannerellaceae bacterium]|jgi:aspartate carbamoyltransferase regulatory subunit|nr:aspartate carbamoyltransferase regulatory subunit [Tannerellaceae bacterium]
MEQNDSTKQVAAIKNGTVIDHIPPEHLFKIIDILEIGDMDNTVTIGYRLPSGKMGRKGMIKIFDKTEFDQTALEKAALLAPNATVNKIIDYKVSLDKDENGGKPCLPLPEKELRNIVKCTNPRCITNNEPMPTLFTWVDRGDWTIKCEYCGRKIKKENFELK